MNILVLHDEAPSTKAVITQLVELGDEYQITLAAWPNLEAMDRETTLDPESGATLLDDADLLVLIADDVALRDFLRLRHVTRLPVLLITPLADEQTIVPLYTAGIDDHLVSPMSTALLAAKLRVWHRWVERLSSLHYH